MSGETGTGLVLAAALAVVSASASCVSFAPDEDPAGAPARDPEGDPPDVEPDIDDPCLCRDDACVEDWMRDHGHCDECAVLSCDRGDVHVCARCSGSGPVDGRSKSSPGELAGQRGGRPGGTVPPPTP
jgi:hypothetical protein